MLTKFPTLSLCNYFIIAISQRSDFTSDFSYVYNVSAERFQITVHNSAIFTLCMHFAWQLVLLLDFYLHDKVYFREYFAFSLACKTFPHLYRTLGFAAKPRWIPVTVLSLLPTTNRYFLSASSVIFFLNFRQDFSAFVSSVNCISVSFDFLQNLNF